MRRRAIGWIVVIVLALAFFWALPALLSMYVDWLWFQEVRQRPVFWTILWAKVRLGLIFGLAFLVLVAGNTLLARRLAPRADWYEAESRFRQQMAEVMERYVARYLIWGILIFSVVVSYWVGEGAARQWMKLLWFQHPTPFGRPDPIFGKDVAFYVFRLPFYEYTWRWLYNALIGVLVVAVVVHYLAKAIRSLGGVPALAPHVKAHLSALLGAVLLVKAAGYILDGYRLLYSPRGVVFGASYTDVHAQLLAYQILMVIAVLCALLVLINIRFRGFWLPAFGIGFLIVASILVSGIYPALIQRLQVDPNEFSRERRFIEQNIEFTNFAYGLHRIEERRFTPQGAVTAADVQGEPGTIGNIRLWDYRPLRQTYKQLQELRLYYVLPEVDIDRYHVKGDYRQVMVAARELDLGALPEKTWQNQHLAYTHGYGVVMSPVNRVSPNGQPEFWVKDIPPTSDIARLKVSRPGLYYQAGDTPIPYSIVRARGIQEIDYATKEKTDYTVYHGRGGIPVGGSLVRLAMAAHFHELNLLITRTIKPDSRILIRRNVAERARRIAPFLLYDYDPYVVVGEDGRLCWIHDAYTISDRMPYSQPYSMPQATFNYIRNSVKVATDAYDGTITFYLVDDKDPVARTYQRIFPGLFTPMSRMPADIRRHIRYPEDLFNTQADMYATYHMRDPEVFYQKEDKWAIARESPGKGSPGSWRQQGKQAGRMEAYYVIMRLPVESPQEERQPEFILLLPFTPAEKQNMIAWMCARCDGDDYGHLIVYAFPKKELFLGPNQIEAMIDQDPDMSQQLTLWKGAGSDVIRGNLLVIPMAKSLLYVEPLFLKAQAGEIPELARVIVGTIVGTGGRVEWAETLEGALDLLVGARAAPGPSRPAAGPPAPGKGVEALVDQALGHYRSAQEKLRQGDWAGYGSEVEALRETLERLKEAGAGPGERAGAAAPAGKGP